MAHTAEELEAAEEQWKQKLVDDAAKAFCAICKNRDEETRKAQKQGACLSCQYPSPFPTEFGLR